MTFLNQVKKRLVQRDVSFRWEGMSHSSSKNGRPIDSATKRPSARARFPLLLPDSLSFQLATTKEHLEAAFRVLHDAYVDMGYMTPREGGLRLTKYHCLPTSAVFVALWKGEVVGTMSVLQNGPFGLPMGELFDLRRFGARGRRAVEVSSLAVRKDYRFSNPSLFLLFSKLGFEYAKNYAGADYVLICVNPKDISYYENVMGFRRLEAPKSAAYRFVNGHPGIGACLPIGRARRYWERGQQGLPRESSALYFFDSFRPAQFILPQRTFHRVADPVLSPELLDYFFNRRTNLFAELSETERRALWRLYPEQEYRRWLPQPRNVPVPNRRFPRFPARLWAKSATGGSWLVTEVGERGVRLQAAALDGGVDFVVEVAQGVEVRLEGRVVWAQPGQSVGIELASVPPLWRAYVGHLNRVWWRGAESVAP